MNRLNRNNLSVSIPRFTIFILALGALFIGFGSNFFLAIGVFILSVIFVLIITHISRLLLELIRLSKS